MKVIIAGDSYSSQIDFRNGLKDIAYTQPYYSWAAELAKLLSIENVSHPGHSLQEIKQSLENKSYDLAIVNFSPINRLPRNINSSHKLTLLNVKSARQLINMPNTYCWSPFPEWEINDGVEVILQPLDDELWWTKDPKRFDTVTGNHFTRAGNERLLRHMLKVVRDKKSRALRATLSTMDDEPRDFEKNK